MEKVILEIGFDKNGEADFGLKSGYLADLTQEQMRDLREIAVVALGQMESARTRYMMEKPENQAHTSKQ